MSLLHALLLGLLQGLTEYLPISSSAHLLLVPGLLGWPALPSDLEKTFAVALHCGTFVGVVAYFWTDLGRLLTAWWRSVVERSLGADPDRRLAWFILVSTVPAAIAGYAGENFISRRLGAPALVAALLIGAGLLLAAAEAVGRKRRNLADLSLADALLIGLAQCLALAPGVSRSGITITTALFASVRREAAARYVFLISVPIIGGTALYKGLQLLRHGLPPGMAAPFLVGVLGAGVAGYVAIRFLLRYLQTHTLYPFVFYRIAVGALFLTMALRR